MRETSSLSSASNRRAIPVSIWAQCPRAINHGPGPLAFVRHNIIPIIIIRYYIWYLRFNVTQALTDISSLFLVNISTVWYFLHQSMTYICVMFVRRGSNYLVCVFEQTNHKHTGTAYNNICVMFVRRGSNYVCLNEVTKFCEGWVIDNQSRINQTFWVLCVVFHFFFSGLVFLLWNRLRSLGWGRISSVRAYKCLDH